MSNPEPLALAAPERVVPALPLRRTGGGVRLATVAAVPRIRTALGRAATASWGAARAVAGVGVAALDRALRWLRHRSERALWSLGYARVDLIEPPALPLGATPRGAPAARLLGPTTAGMSPRVSPPLRDAIDPARAVTEFAAEEPFADEAQTRVYPGDPTVTGSPGDEAQTAVGIPRFDTVDEVTRVAPDNVLSLARHRARRKR